MLKKIINKLKNKPADKLRAEIGYLVSFRPQRDTIIRGTRISQHMTPAELATMRTNSVMKRFTFRNVIKYKIFKLRLRAWNLLTNETK